MVENGGFLLNSNILLDSQKKSLAYAREANSPEESRSLAKALAVLLKPGDFVALMGELGTGKTVFVQAVAEALKCEQRPSSPTFSLVQIHAGGIMPLCHVDLYRLSLKEVPGLEWEEIFNKQGVALVEWAEKAQNFWPPASIPVHIAHQGENRRLFTFYSIGLRSGEVIQKLKSDDPKGRMKKMDLPSFAPPLAGKQ
jgi:tRNA threonylcarbamoyladenosine biosynthesis protein TsaE